MGSRFGLFVSLSFLMPIKTWRLVQMSWAIMRELWEWKPFVRKMEQKDQARAPQYSQQSPRSLTSRCGDWLSRYYFYSVTYNLTQCQTDTSNLIFHMQIRSWYKYCCATQLFPLTDYLTVLQRNCFHEQWILKTPFTSWLLTGIWISSRSIPQWIYLCISPLSELYKNICKVHS